MKKLFLKGTIFLFLNKAVFLGLLALISGFFIFQQPAQEEIKEMVVWASWYGPGFHGKKMASGKKFNMKEPLAAHPTLPLGTKIKVTNLVNKRSIVVAVLDRGPYISGRELDLYYVAARRLGGIKAGLIPVKIKVLSQ